MLIRPAGKADPAFSGPRSVADDDPQFVENGVGDVAAWRL